MDKDEILGTADLLGLLPHNGAELMYITDDTLIDFANRIHAAGVREGMVRAAAMCECRVMALDHGGNEYRREAPASHCAAFIRAAAEKIGANNE